MGYEDSPGADRVQHFDPQRNRPGLPQDVAALVEKLEANRTVLKLVNLSPIDSRSLHVQMPPATEMELQLDMARFANAPSYAVPARQSTTPSA
jgi:hypothetical protein